MATFKYIYVLVTDEDPSEYPEDRDNFKLIDKVPGHEIDRWSIVDRTEHIMSTGRVIIYCYRKTGQSHLIEEPETNIYDFNEFSDEEEDEEDEADEVDLLPKDKLRSYVQNMYAENSHYTSFVNSSRDMLLSRGTNLSRGQSRGAWQNRTNLCLPKETLLAFVVGDPLMRRSTLHNGTDQADLAVGKTVEDKFHYLAVVPVGQVIWDK